MKKYYLLMMALIALPLMLGAQVLNIGGHRAPMDELNHIWLCSVPQSTFGTDFSAQVVYGEAFTDLAIEGTAVASGEEFVFEGVTGGKQYTVTAHQGDSLITGAITFTWLPVVELNGTFGYSYKYGTVTVSDPDSAFAEPMQARLKWRGIATNTTTKNKRNYRIKFINEDSTKLNRTFFGLRNDNTWILDAGQMDFLRVRNRVSTDLWLDMARKPWYADSVTSEIHNGSRGHMVEVLLNGRYAGIYNMCEPIDRKQMRVKRFEPETQTFHGQLWMAYTWTRTVNMNEPVKRTKGSRFWDGFELKYPDHDETGLVRWDVMENAVWFGHRAFENDQLIADSLSYYFDLPVMQDYYIFIAALQALDNESKNIYYACRDIQVHPRLTMAPWDLDICLGQDFSPSANIPEMVKPERPMDWVTHLPMLEMMNNEEYRNEVIARYKELRQTVLSTDNMVNRYRAAIDELENSGAAAREEARWSGNTDLAKNKLDLSAEMDYVEDWIRRRMAYLDEYVFNPDVTPGPGPQPSIKGDVNGDGEVSVADVNMLVNIILGGADNSEGRSDVNADGEVSLADINEVIGIILG
jgi:hypothetical protein